MTPHFPIGLAKPAPNSPIKTISSVLVTLKVETEESSLLREDESKAFLNHCLVQAVLPYQVAVRQIYLLNTHVAYPQYFVSFRSLTGVTVRSLQTCSRQATTPV